MRKSHFTETQIIGMIKDTGSTCMSTMLDVVVLKDLLGKALTTSNHGCATGASAHGEAQRREAALRALRGGACDR